MATIKTRTVQGQRRIITKVVNGQRRVSCSCCEEGECCPYPAEYYGSLFDLEDLPDEVVGIGQDNAYEANFIKNGSGDTPYGGFIDEFPARIIRVNIFGFWYWDLQAFTESNQWVSFQDVQPNPCLIYEPFAENGSFTKDNFEDTYKITAYRANNEIQWIYTVERVSLCRWEYQIPKGDVVSLIYNDGVNLGPSFSPPHKWLASDDQEWSGIKSGFSNTPVGTYPDAWNLEVGGRIEVEEL
jgi:hypothetical protein